MNLVHVAYVDIDDTLIRSFGSKRIPMTHVVRYVKSLKEKGYTLYAWSMGGAEYAQKSAEELGITDIFSGFLPKPTMLVDDEHKNIWRVACVHPNDCHGTD